MDTQGTQGAGGRVNEVSDCIRTGKKISLLLCRRAIVGKAKKYERIPAAFAGSSSIPGPCLHCRPSKNISRGYTLR